MTSKRRRKIQNKRATIRGNLKRKYGSIRSAHEALLKKTQGKCWICGGEIHEGVTIDHIQPITKGGNNNWNNLMPAHELCNKRRKNLENEEKRM